MEYTESDFEESDRDSSNEDIEAELYSVLHYNTLNGDISNDLHEKYNITKNEQNEYFISLKDCNKKVEEDLIEKTVVTDAPNLKDIPEVIENPDITQLNEISNNSKLPGKKRKSLERSSSKPKKKSNETDQSSNCVVIISDDDDDDDDSDVVILEPVHDIASVSSGSSITDLSDTGSVLINTSLPNIHRIFPSDDNESEEEIDVKWNEVQSPSTWTSGMKKYYNKPNRKLKYFDHIKSREELKGHSCREDWKICQKDMFPRKGPVKRCTICRATDHLQRNCPRQSVACYMCGISGHHESSCPYRMCLNCGRKNHTFVPMCFKCDSIRHKTCSECNQIGHLRENCPDTWRRFHSTTSGELVIKTSDVNSNLMCCNCGEKGHLFENCTHLYWSHYPPTSSLVKKTIEAQSFMNSQGKRKQYFDSPGSTPNRKKAKWRENPGNNNKVKGKKKFRYWNGTEIPKINEKKMKRMKVNRKQNKLSNTV